MENKTKTILIVDDLPLNLELLSEIFQDSFNIITATGGEEALNILESSADSIDVVLLDAVMPKMSGYELLEIMGKDERLKNIPALIITADYNPETLKRAYDCGAVDFIARPFSIKSVIRRVNSALQKRDLDTVLKKYEQLKIRSDTEKRLAALLDHLPGGVAIIETDGKSAACTYCNHAIPSLFGISENEFISRFHNDDLEPWISYFIEHAGDGAKLEHIFYVDKKGEADEDYSELIGSRQWIKMSATGLGNADGKTVMYCVFLDVNNEKIQQLRVEEADKKLKQNEIRLESLLNKAPGALIFCQRNSEGRMKVFYLSKGLSDILGYPDDQKCLEAISDDPTAGISKKDLDNFKKLMRQAETEGGIVSYSFNCFDYNRRPIWILFQGQLTVTEDGNLRMYGFASDITKEKSYEHELRINAFYDVLTGLYNRKAFYYNAKKLLESDPDHEYWVVRFNIGNFKLINDILGREVGDRVLIAVADVIRAEMKDRAIYARFSSDHFVMMSCHFTKQKLLDLIEKIKTEVKKTGIVPHEVQYYIGVFKVLKKDRDITVESMCDRAMLACNSISGSFFHHIALYDDKMRKKMLEEQQICDQAHKAMENGEFQLYYQPIYGVKAKKFVSAEALVRWIHPEKGLISPGKFIPVFEKNGLIADLDAYVLEQVCIYHQKRRVLGLPPFPISVNISRMSLYNPRLFEMISGLTEKYNVKPELLRIEITESAYNDNPAQLLETVGKLRSNHYPILMDDFGSGYSSLNTLKDIPIDLLKLDMKFMQGFEKSGKVSTIVTSVARMAKWLNVPMLAEGVENKEQFDFLQGIGCAYIQGYYFSKPISEGEFTALITKNNVTPGDSVIETYGMGEEVSEILGHNAIISKLIGGIFGGLGIYEMVNNKLEVIRVNEGYMEIMGYSPEEQSCEYNNVLEKVYPDDINTCLEACQKAALTDKAVRMVVRRYDKNGELLTLEGVLRRLGGSKEHTIFCIAFNDISEQLKNDEIIRRSRNQIHNILDATGSVVVDMDYNSDSFYYAGELDAYDVTSGQLLGMLKGPDGLVDIAHPEDKEKIRAFHGLIKQGRTSDDFRIKKVDGDYHWVRLTKTLSLDENGKPSRLMAIANDIDAAKKASIALEFVRVQIQAALENMNAGIMVIENGRYVYSNDQFWRFIDRTPDDSFNFFEEFPKLVTKEETLRVIASADSGEAARCNFSVVTKEGKETWLELALVSVHGKETETKRYMVILTNVTQQYMTSYKLDAIVKNYDGGLALINRDVSGKYSLEYANGLFYSMVNLEKTDSDKLEKILAGVIDSNQGSTDITVTHKDGQEHIINIRIMDTGIKSHSGSFVADAADVTQKRHEAIRRVAERNANTKTGLYDEVFEVNYKEHTTIFTYSRRSPQRALNAKPQPFEMIVNWVEKYVHPKDRQRAIDLYSAPDSDPNFTDSYEVLQVLDYLDNKYKTFGMTLVRSGEDTCTLFTKDLDRIDDLYISEDVRETNRLYQLLAEQTNITVVEYDHVSDRISASPSMKHYAFSKLSRDEIKSECKSGFGIHPDDKKSYDLYIKSLDDDNDTLKYCTLRLEMADGSYKWCRLCVTFKKSPDGKLLKSLCTINMVHEQIEAQRQAEKTNALMRRTVRHIPVGVSICQVEDGSVVPIFISDNTYQLFGLNGISKKIDSAVYTDFVKNISLKPGNEGEYVSKCFRPNGDSFWLSTKYRILEENGSLFIYAAMDDCSFRIEAKKRQTVQDQLYQVLLDETGTVVFDYNVLDELFAYYEPAKIASAETGSRFASIKGVIKDCDQLYFIAQEDREKFSRALYDLAKWNNGDKQTDTQELTLKVMSEGYPRRYRAFFKSMRDDMGMVFRIVGKIEDVDDEMERLEKIQAKAMYDALCVDVYNKATTEELIREELEESTSGSLLMIDVDDFKSINDRLGHLFGDEFLKKVASVIKSEFRDTDIVGRYGGDEYFVFIKHTGQALAEKKGKQILKRIAAIEVPEIGSVKGSVGVAVVNPDNRNYAQLMKQADSALYAAKNRGKNCVVIFDGDTMEAGVYRTEQAVEKGGEHVEISSNPNGFESLIMRIFSALYTSGDLNSGISQMLAMAGKAFDVSRAYIFEDTDDGKYCCNTFEWCNEGVKPEIDKLQLVSYEEDLGGNYHENMNDDGIFYCHDVSELNTSQRKILEAQNIKSVLQSAIMDNGKFMGFVGFDECRSNRFWTQEQIDALVFISKVLSIFLLKERGRLITESYARSVNTILDDFPLYVYVVEKNTKKILYMNNLIKNALGGNLVGQCCRDVICRSQFMDCPLAALDASDKSKPVIVHNPGLKSNMRTQASEIVWKGEKAYLIISEEVED